MRYGLRQREFFFMLTGGGFSWDAFESEVIATSPVAYYPLDEGSGTTFTDVISSRNGTASGIEWQTRYGRNVPYFNGTTANANVTGAALTALAAALDIDLMSMLVWYERLDWTISDFSPITRIQTSASDRFYVYTNAPYQVGGFRTVTGQGNFIYNLDNVVDGSSKTIAKILHSVDVGNTYRGATANGVTKNNDILVPATTAGINSIELVNSGVPPGWCYAIAFYDRAIDVSDTDDPVVQLTLNRGGLK